MGETIKIDSPHDLKRLKIDELNGVCEYVKSRIISVVEKNGGHLSSNLGTIELTVALHYVFDCPNDRIIFDVGHQSYAHKILTGRDGEFDSLRTNGGISGFPKPKESEYDAFGTGHASTSLSVALGLAEAAKRCGEHRATIAVIGDGALTGGLCYEAMNVIGSEQAPVIIVLNDNEMSISKNVGAMSTYLTRLRVSKKYVHAKGVIKRAVATIPFFGDGAIHLMERGKSVLKRMVLSNRMFEELGISYYGPFDGHNIKELVDVFSQLKNKKSPVLVHVLTDKGHGLKSAAIDPAHSHGISALKASEGADFSAVLGEFMESAAQNDSRVMGVTAAMAIGTGLEDFSKKFPDNFKDVGIAEEHATTYCAALAAGGMKPYFAVYSTFLQRAFDEIMHDVAIGGYPVTFCIDRAGAVGADGETHQGVFDLSYLGMIPNMTVMCPTDGNEFRAMLDFSLGFDAPLAIRYPKTYAQNREHTPIVLGKWESAEDNGASVYALCVGPRMTDIARRAAEKIKLNIINCRFVKPLDTEFLDSINKKGNKIITLEDNVRRGGFGDSVLAYLNSIGCKAKCAVLAHPDEFIDNMDINDTLEKSGLSVENLINTVKNLE